MDQSQIYYHDASNQNEISLRSWSIVDLFPTPMHHFLMSLKLTMNQLVSEAYQLPHLSNLNISYVSAMLKEKHKEFEKCIILRNYFIRYTFIENINEGIIMDLNDCIISNKRCQKIRISSLCIHFPESYISLLQQKIDTYTHTHHLCIYLNPLGSLQDTVFLANKERQL